MGRRATIPSEERRRDASSLTALTLTACAAGAYGLLSSRLPAPDDPGVFWISNLAAPYVVIPFVAGWLQRSRVWAAAAGVVVCATMVAAFYQHTWYVPYVARWLLVVVPVGLLFGLLGHAMRTSGSPLPALVLGLAMVLEPVYWYVKLGFLPSPHVIWVGEAAVAVLLAVFLLRARQRRTQTL